jgi:Reverse transcriptase (RNA-dependent DNA polymerase)
LPKEKWDKLSDKEKEERRKKRAATGIVKRKVAAAETNADAQDSVSDDGGNKVPTGQAGDAFGSQAKRVRMVKGLTTSERRQSAPKEGNVAAAKTVSNRGRVEIDSHADTHALGKGFVVLTETTRTCTVSPFTDGLGMAQDVDIVSAATAWDAPSGETFLLVFHEALWFGDSMEVSLLNPNQCRQYGIKVWDDPTDEDRPIGITDPTTEVVIPMEMNGMLVGFDVRTPTKEELHNCVQIVMSSAGEWNPKEVSFSIGQLEKARLSSAISKDRHSKHTPEELAKKWRCSLSTAKKTMEATTQLAIQHAVHPLRRRYRTDIAMTGYNRLKTRMYLDTMFSKVKSLKGNTCAQVFCDHAFVRVIPMASKAEAGAALQTFAQDVGIPMELLVDSSGEQVGLNTEFSRNMKRYDIALYQIEPYTPRQNLAERIIGELRRRWRSRMTSVKVPARLWDYALVYEAEILSRMVRGNETATGIDKLTGNSVDISEWLDFSFYDLVWFWHTPGEDNNPQMGRWLGVAHRIGSELCYYILVGNGSVAARTTVQHITELEQRDPVTVARVAAFDAGLDERLNDPQFWLEGGNQPGVFLQDVVFEEDDDELHDNGEPTDKPEVETEPQFSEDTVDEYIGAELWVPTEGEFQSASVTARKRDFDGNPVGIRNTNPMLDTREYEVTLQDGGVMAYNVNTITEYLSSHIDDDGNRVDVFHEIVDHEVRRGKTSTGDKWTFCVEFADGTTKWMPYATLRAQDTVELAVYAYSNKLLDEPVFAQWAPKLLREHDKLKARVIAKVKSKSKYHSLSHKFGVELPKTVKKALAIDHESGNDLWRKAIEKEMTNVRPAFEIWDGTVEQARSNKRLVGYQFINCHMIFDVKMDDLVRKARFVAGGHMTEAPTSITYSSVVSRESVRIALLIASLNDLDVWAADVGNAYLNAPCREKIWTVAGPEFGSDEGKVMIIKRALYGLKSSGAAWRAMLAGTLSDMGFTSMKADPDVWFRGQVGPMGKYYEYVLIYVDDILCISHAPKDVMDVLSQTYRLKEGSVGPPSRYLGANLEKVMLDNGDVCWSMSADSYIKSAIDNIEKQFEKDGYKKFRYRLSRPYNQNYKPEVDATPLLKDSAITHYQGLIGVARWACEIGRLDILTEIALLSAYNAAPRRGHLEALLQVFSYMKRHPKTSIVFDHRIPDVDRSGFCEYDWTEFYGDIKESIPPNVPEPLGKAVHISCFVDADHAGNVVTRRSHSGILIVLNKSPIQWFSKRQNTVESSTFGSELIAMKQAVDHIEALRYKLRMMGIPVPMPADVYCDNQSVIYNTSVPASMLSKKHNAIAYHRVREAVAMRMIVIAKVESKWNLADGFTKPLPAPRHRFIYSRIMTGLGFPPQNDTSASVQDGEESTEQSGRDEAEG